MQEPPLKVKKTEASQGRSGVGVRYVLMGGLALVIIAFAIIYLVVR